jgi:hypothetical protein
MGMYYTDRRGDRKQKWSTIRVWLAAALAGLFLAFPAGVASWSSALSSERAAAEWSEDSRVDCWVDRPGIQIQNLPGYVPWPGRPVLASGIPSPLSPALAEDTPPSMSEPQEATAQGSSPPVPEPATIFLVGTGLTCLAYLYRRKTHK